MYLSHLKIRQIVSANATTVTDETYIRNYIQSQVGRITSDMIKVQYQLIAI